MDSKLGCWKIKWVTDKMALNSVTTMISSTNKSAKKTMTGKGAVSSLIISCAIILNVSGCQSVDAFTPINYSGSDGKSRSKSNPEDVAQIRTTLAGQYIRSKQLDAATRQLEMAFKANKRYAPAYDMMGVLLQQEGSQRNLKEAERYFKKSIRLDKNFIQAHNNYGVYLSYMKRYEEAVREFQIAGSALGYQGRVSALENLGRTHLKLKNNSEATKAFLRALENDPNSLVARIELVDLLINANHISKARQLFEEVKVLLGNRPLSPRLMLQGAKLAHASRDGNTKQEYASQLLSAYPLSEEAKLLKQWLRNPNATWK